MYKIDVNTNSEFIWAVDWFIEMNQNQNELCRTTNDYQLPIDRNDKYFKMKYKHLFLSCKMFFLYFIS